MENDLGKTLLRNEVFVQSFLIRALVDTHPDKATLKKAFAHYCENYLANVLPVETTEESIRAFQMHREHWEQFIATPRQEKP